LRNPGADMKSHIPFYEDFRRDAGGSHRSFGFVAAGACAVIWMIKYWRGHNHWEWWLAEAAVFLILALAWPRSLQPLNWLWTQFGLLLHRIAQPVAMGLLFFTTIVPMGLLFRAMGKDFLRQRFDPSARSYWIMRNPPGPEPGSFKNQF